MQKTTDEHLTVQDVQELVYQNELGDLLEPEDHLKITRHLDNCDLCKKRFVVNELGIVKDRKDTIMGEVDELIQKVIEEAREENNSPDAIFDYCTKHPANEHMKNLLKEYESYGGDIMDYIRNLLKQKGIRV